MGCLLRSLMMLALPLAFFWVPVPGLGGFLAGLIGGYLSGGPVRAILSALLPVGVIAGLIVAVSFHIGAPVIGSAIGGIAVILLILHDLTLLAGSFVGGLLALTRRPARSPVA